MAEELVADEDDENVVDAEGFRTLMTGVKYKELKAGTGPQAEYKQAVICTWEAKLADGTVFERGARKMLRVGDGDAPPGLELGLRQLQDGTKCVVRAVNRFAYGDKGRPASSVEATLEVPPGADVEWTIEAHRLWYKDSDELPPMEQLVDARNKKTLGNEHFHHENWVKAGSNYQEIIKNLNVWNFDEETDEREEAESIYVDCGNNLVFALMKMDEWLKAEKAICDVLTVAPEHQKALYRAAQIALHLSKWEEATAAIQLGLELWPRSKDFRDLYNKLRQDKLKYRERKAKMKQKMSKDLFGGKVEEPAVAEPPEEDGRRCLLQ